MQQVDAGACPEYQRRVRGVDLIVLGHADVVQSQWVQTTPDVRPFFEQDLYPLLHLMLASWLFKWSFGSLDGRRTAG